jgi:hypothetical protein
MNLGNLPSSTRRSTPAAVTFENPTGERLRAAPRRSQGAQHAVRAGESVVLPDIVAGRSPHLDDHSAGAAGSAVFIGSSTTA